MELTEADKVKLTRYLSPYRLLHGFHIYPVEHNEEKDKVRYSIANTCFWLSPKQCYKKDVERLIKHLALHLGVTEVDVLLKLGEVGHRGYDDEYRGPKCLKCTRENPICPNWKPCYEGIK